MADPSPADPSPEPSRDMVEATTAPLPPVGATTAIDEASTIRLFNSPAFFRLWLAQVVSSLGDWLGFVAITALAARVGGSSPEAAISLVLSARLVPGLFLAPLAGVLVDRWDRRRTMVVCDVGRGAVFATLPFVDTVLGLVVASLILEVLTLMWQPAKEASVPKLVQPQFLSTANSLSLVAAYGTFPIGAGLFALFAKVADWLGRYDALDALRVNQESVAIYFNVITFFIAGAIIWTLPLRRPRRVVEHHEGAKVTNTFDELREGWRFIRSSGVVRAVIFGLATGLFGGAMVVPLGPIFVAEVLGGGTAAFGLLLTAMGTGVAVGMGLLSVAQRRLSAERIFVLALLGGGASLIAGASVSTLALALLMVSVLGVCAGGVYILGFTILQTCVEDELRGRIFATLYTLIRFTVVLSFVLTPVVSRLLSGLSRRLFDGEVELLGVVVHLPGVRLTLWLGGMIILAAGVVAVRNVRSGSTVEA